MNTNKIKAKVEEVRLRKLNYSDISRLSKLANNRKISINLRDAFPFPYTEKDAENFIRNVNLSNPVTVFAIEYKSDYVGNIGLSPGNDVYRKSAELGYFLFEDYWNKGIMEIAINKIVEFGFNQLDLIRIHAGIFDFNAASQRVLEKCGFKKEGVFEKAILKDGKICNEIRFAIIRI